jgi:hypothetical protein
MIYEALNKALERTATASLTCIQFTFSLFSRSSAAVSRSAGWFWLLRVVS